MNKNKIGTGIILILFIFVNDFSNITNWSSAELIGYNIWSILLPIAGLVVLVSGIIENKDQK